VKVDAYLNIAGYDNVFVIGDTAAAINDNGKPLPGVAPVAMQQGRYVAQLIDAQVRGDSAARKPFHYIDKGNMATVGRAFAIVEVKKLHMSGFIAWFVWLSVHIAYLIGFRNRILVMIQWAWAYLTYQRGARLITKEN
jgi:NADH dehydrogenase